MIGFIIYITISLILVAVSSISEAIMDKIQFHWYKSIFSINPNKYREDFWNPYFSWRNKYSDVQSKIPKFIGSTTIFVFLTDAWHLFKFFKNLSIFLVILFSFLAGYYYDFNMNFILFSLIYVSFLRLLYGMCFTLFFDKILEYKDIFGTAGKQNTPSNEIKSDWMDKVNGLK